MVKAFAQFGIAHSPTTRQSETMPHRFFRISVIEIACPAPASVIEWALITAPVMRLGLCEQHSLRDQVVNSAHRLSADLLMRSTLED